MLEFPIALHNLHGSLKAKYILSFERFLNNVGCLFSWSCCNFAHEGVGISNDYLSNCLPSPTRNGRKKTPRHYVDNEILSWFWILMKNILYWPKAPNIPFDICLRSYIMIKYVIVYYICIKNKYFYVMNLEDLRDCKELELIMKSLKRALFVSLYWPFLNWFKKKKKNRYICLARIFEALFRIK